MTFKSWRVLCVSLTYQNILSCPRPSLPDNMTEQVPTRDQTVTAGSAKNHWAETGIVQWAWCPPCLRTPPGMVTVFLGAPWPFLPPAPHPCLVSRTLPWSWAQLKATRSRSRTTVLQAPGVAGRNSWILEWSAASGTTTTPPPTGRPLLKYFTALPRLSSRKPWCPTQSWLMWTVLSWRSLRQSACTSWTYAALWRWVIGLLYFIFHRSRSVRYLLANFTGYRSYSGFTLAK